MFFCNLKLETSAYRGYNNLLAPFDVLFDMMGMSYR